MAWPTTKRLPTYLQTTIVGIEPESGSDMRLATGRVRDPKKIVEVVQETRRPGRRDIVKELSQPSSQRYYFSEPFVGPQHDLKEVLRLMDIESYFQVCVSRHVELIMKNGFAIKGHNPEVVAWVKRRIAEIEIMSSQPFGDMVREVTRNLVAMGNAHMVFMRDRERASGARIRMWNKDLEPIANISIPNSAFVKVRQNKNGRPNTWVQMGVTGSGERKTWPYYDVAHFAYNRKSGYIFGTPFVIPVLEDIRGLRKMEMLAEHLCHKNAFPMLHLKVGTDEWPADKVVDPSSGTAVYETALARQLLEEIAQEGFMATSHRFTLELIGAEGKVMDIKPYIEHYRDRVLAGLRLSKLDVGEGDTANRGTANHLSQILVDSCQEFQNVISETMKTKLLDILVLEGGYHLTPENEVTMSWPPIDAEAARAHQNHGLNLYLSNTITRAEFRQEYLAKDDLTPEEEVQLFATAVTLPMMEAQAKFKAKYDPPKEGPTGSAKSRAMPSNQFGTMLTKPAVPANDVAQLVDAAKAAPTPNDAMTICRTRLKAMWESVDKAIDESWKMNFAAAGGKIHPVNSKDALELFRQRFFSSDLLTIGAAVRTVPSGRSGGEVVQGLFDSRTERAVHGAAVLGLLDAKLSAGILVIKTSDMNGQDEREIEIPQDPLDRALLVSSIAFLERRIH